MLYEILINGLFRTLVEIMPFTAVVAIELKGTPYQRMYQRQFDAYKNASLMPDFTDPNDDDEAAIKNVATFSVAEHDTRTYSAYSFVVITVIFFSKIPAILAFPAGTKVQIGVFAVGILLWAVAIYLLYRWRSSAERFYDDISPFNYFRAEDDELYYRSVTIPLIGTKQLKRHRADLFLFNATPIFVVLVFNIVLIGTAILVTPSGGAAQTL